MNRSIARSVALPLGLLAAACSQDAAPPAEDLPAAPAPAAATEDAPASAPVNAPVTGPASGPAKAAGEWRMLSSGEGDGLFFARSDESAPIHLFCPREGGLLVNVERFAPIGSEERMSLGSGGTVVTLVADPAGDPLRGGVSGEGPVPAELRAILTGAGGVGVNYGAQNLGPLPPVPGSVAGAFLAACAD